MWRGGNGTDLASTVTSTPSHAPGFAAVLVGTRSGELYALDPTDGDVLWVFQAPDAIVLTPAVDSAGHVFVAAGSDLHVVLAASGEALAVHHHGCRITSYPALSSAFEGAVVFGDADGSLNSVSFSGKAREGGSAY